MAIPLPNISAGGGGPSGATSSSKVGNELFSPFNFGNDGWNVTVNSSGTGQNATTGKDANKPASGLLDSLVGAEYLPYLIGGAVLLLVLLRRN